MLAPLVCACLARVSFNQDGVLYVRGLKWIGSFLKVAAGTYIRKRHANSGVCVCAKVRPSWQYFPLMKLNLIIVQLF